MTRLQELKQQVREYLREEILTTAKQEQAEWVIGLNAHTALFEAIERRDFGYLDNLRNEWVNIPNNQETIRWRCVIKMLVTHNRALKGQYYIAAIDTLIKQNFLKVLVDDDSYEAIRDDEFQIVYPKKKIIRLKDL